MQQMHTSAARLGGSVIDLTADKNVVRESAEVLHAENGSTECSRPLEARLG